MFNPYPAAGGFYQQQQPSRPNLDTPQGAAAYADGWDQYVGQIQQALAASSGWETKKLQAELENAEKGRQNAYAIAKLQAETSRYGVDAQRATAMAQLKENARQFDATHALEMQKLGLNYAQTATEYLSTPDRFFQAADFIGMAGRALGRTSDGSQGPTPYTAQGTPTPKTEGDFAALAGYTMPTPNGGGGQKVTPSASPYPASGAGAGAGAAPSGVPNVTTDAAPGAVMPTASGAENGMAAAGVPGAASVYQAAAGPGAGQDNRAKALKALIDAVPPSGVAGLDNNDFAVLQAAKALYSTNLTPGTLERMRPGQQAIFASAGKRLGYDVNDWKADYDASKPWQRSVRAA